MNIQRFLIVISTVLAASIQVIDGTIVNVAIPTMMSNLGIDLNSITWVSSSYLIAHVVILPIIGWLSQTLGRKKYLLYCILVFILASVGCGFSPNLWVLVFFRIIQGFAGGALMPISLSLLFEAFPENQKAKAAAIFGVCVMISPAFGPLMGGYLTEYFGWPYIFFVNVPIGLLAILIGIIGIPEEKGQSFEKIDYWGLCFLFVGLGFFQFAIERGETMEWFSSNWIAFSFLMAAIFIPAFIFRCLNAEKPLLDLSLLKSARMNISCMVNLLVGYILYGVSFLIPVYAQRVWDLSTVQIGWIFVPSALITSLFMPLVSYSTKAFRPSLVMAFGMFLSAVGFYYFSQINNVSSHFSPYLPATLSRLGFAFSLIPATLVAMEGFKGRQSTEVSALLNFSRQLGGSVSFAIIATLLTNFQKRFYGILKADISSLNYPVQQMQASLQEKLTQSMPLETGEGTYIQMAGKVLQEKVYLQSFVLSYDRIMWISMFVTLFAVVLMLCVSFIFKRKKAK
ncbi:MAG: Multidrug export protein EmrB [Chlamydiae bacterium]|nr:Multidrug export protein EmrB [Chlamydiota bacterium]